MDTTRRPYLILLFLLLTLTGRAQNMRVTSLTTGQGYLSNGMSFRFTNVFANAYGTNRLWYGTTSFDDEEPSIFVDASRWITFRQDAATKAIYIGEHGGLLEHNWDAITMRVADSANLGNGDPRIDFSTDDGFANQNNIFRLRFPDDNTSRLEVSNGTILQADLIKADSTGLNFGDSSYPTTLRGAPVATDGAFSAVTAKAFLLTVIRLPLGGSGTNIIWNGVQRVWTNETTAVRILTNLNGTTFAATNLFDAFAYSNPPAGSLYMSWVSPTSMVFKTFTASPTLTANGGWCTITELSTNESLFGVSDSGLVIRTNILVEATLTANGLAFTIFTNNVVDNATNFTVNMLRSEQYISATNNLNFAHASNHVAGLVLYATTTIENWGAVNRTLRFPSTWNWHGTTNNPPTTLYSNQVHTLSLKSYGAGHTNIIAAWGD